MNRMVEPPSKHLELERDPRAEPKLQPTNPHLAGRSDMPVNLTRQEKIASIYPRGGDNTVEVSHREAEWVSQNKTSKIKTLFIVVPAICILAYGAFWFWPSPVTNPYSKVTGKTPYFSYSLQFDPRYKQTQVGTTTLLTGEAMYSDTAITVGIGSNHNQTGDCVGSATGDSVRVVSYEQVNGEQHTLCYTSSLSMYSANFRYRNTWYFIGIWAKDTKDKNSVDIKTVRAIVNSLEVGDY